MSREKQELLLIYAAIDGKEDTINSFGMSKEELESLLIYAAIDSRADIIRSLLMNEVVNVDCKDQDGWTPLFCACTYGYSEVVQLLLDRGAAVQEADKELTCSGSSVAKYTSNWIPLHAACESGHSVVAQLLLDRGAAVQAVNKLNWTALHWACVSGDAAMRRCGDCAAVAGQRSRHRSCQQGWLDCSSFCLPGHITVVQLLLDSGAVVEAIDKRGKLPFEVVNDSELRSRFETMAHHNILL